MTTSSPSASSSSTSSSFKKTKLTQPQQRRVSQLASLTSELSSLRVDLAVSLSLDTASLSDKAKDSLVDGEAKAIVDEHIRCVSSRGTALADLARAQEA